MKWSYLKNQCIIASKNKLDMYIYNSINVCDIEIENQCIKCHEMIEDILKEYLKNNFIVKKDNRNSFLYLLNNYNIKNEQEYKLFKCLALNITENECTNNSPWNYMIVNPVTNNVQMLKIISQNNSIECIEYVYFNILNSTNAKLLEIYNIYLEIQLNSNKRINRNEISYKVFQTFNIHQVYNTSFLDYIKYNLCQINSKNNTIENNEAKYCNICKICETPIYNNYTLEITISELLNKINNKCSYLIIDGNYNDCIFIVQHLTPLYIDFLTTILNTLIDTYLNGKITKKFIYKSRSFKLLLQLLYNYDIMFNFLNKLSNSSKSDFFLEVLMISLILEHNSDLNTKLKLFKMLYNFNIKTTSCLVKLQIQNVIYNGNFTLIISNIIQFYTTITPYEHIENKKVTLSTIIKYYDSLAYLFSNPNFVTDYINYTFYYFYTRIKNLNWYDTELLIKYNYILKAYDIKTKINVINAINDVDALIILLFETTNLSDLNMFYKPNLREFIKNNIGKLMYLLKKYFLNSKSYQHSKCIFHVLCDIISLFGNKIIIEYLNPIIEYFILNYNCCCKIKFIKLYQLNPTSKSYWCIQNMMGNEEWASCNIQIDNTKRKYTDTDLNILDYMLTNIDEFKNTNLYGTHLLSLLGSINILTNVNKHKTYDTPYDHLLYNYLLSYDLNDFHNTNEIELFYFVIQTYVKHNKTFTNVFLEQYKNTKYKYMGNIYEEFAYTIENDKFIATDVLRSFYLLLYQNLIIYNKNDSVFQSQNYEYFKYLILLNNKVVEESLIQMIYELEKNSNQKIILLINNNNNIEFEYLIKKTTLFLDLSNIFIQLKQFFTYDEIIDLAIKEKQYFEFIESYSNIIHKDLINGGFCTNNRLITDLHWFTQKQHNIKQLSKYQIDLFYAFYNLEDFIKCKLIEEDEYTLLGFFIKSKLDKTNITEILKKIEITNIDLFNKINKYESEINNIDNKISYMEHIKSDIELFMEVTNKTKAIELIKKRYNYIHNKIPIIKYHVTTPTILKSYLIEDYINILIEKNELIQANNFIIDLICAGNMDILYEYSKIKLLENKKKEANRALVKLLKVDQLNSNLLKKTLVLQCEIIQKKKQFEENIIKLKALNTNSNNEYYLIKVYFMYAKALENIDNGNHEHIIHSIWYYFLSFEYNYESIPRFIYLINQIKGFKYNYKKNIDIEYLLQANKSGFENDILSFILYQILQKYLNLFINYFQHLLTNNTHEFIQLIIKNMIKKYNNLLWKAVLYLKVNSNLIDDTDLHFNLYKHNLLKSVKLYIDISKSTRTNIKLKTHFPKLYDLVSANIHVPGTNSSIYIEDYDDDVFIFNSLQKPKRIGIRGSDGQKYFYILKNKDDLRRDTRFMDLNHLLNKLFFPIFKKNIITTYTIIPFTENSGLLEYISGLESIKDIIQRYYSHEKLTSYALKYQKRKKMDKIGFEKAITELEPVLYKHFAKYSINKLYIHINNYTLSYTTMCVVGWFMGLGDRHLENILIQKSDNTVVHVDLNLIFESGKKLCIPEKVPFRLTPNIIDGFGIFILKEFKIIFGKILQSLIDNKETIIANLLSFVYDPIAIKVHLNPEDKIEQINMHIQNLNESGKLILNTLCTKLNKTMEIEEKINTLVEEAISVENLREMFIGWMPYL